MRERQRFVEEPGNTRLLITFLQNAGIGRHHPGHSASPELDNVRQEIFAKREALDVRKRFLPLRDWVLSNQ